MISVRERLLNEIDKLSDEQLEAVLRYVEVMQSTALPADYDPDSDPAIGFLPGSTDIASRAKQILRDEITSRSGWTQKKD